MPLVLVTDLLPRTISYCSNKDDVGGDGSKDVSKKGRETCLVVAAAAATTFSRKTSFVGSNQPLGENKIKLVGTVLEQYSTLQPPFQNINSVKYLRRSEEKQL